MAGLNFVKILEYFFSWVKKFKEIVYKFTNLQSYNLCNVPTFLHFIQCFWWTSWTQEVGKYANGKYEVIVEEKDIAWPNGGKKAPLAEPECGFNGEKCGGT